MSQSSDNFVSKKDCPICEQKLVRNGQYFRKSDSKSIKRWRCLSCEITISQATGTPSFAQNKRRVNESVRKLLASGCSQRSIAYVLGINRKTVARKLQFLATQAKNRQQSFLKNYFNTPTRFVQFDEMETHEHTKLKPLSIPLIVDAKTRIILGFGVASMPAKGKLAGQSRRKYGHRNDDRPKEALYVLKAASDYTSPVAEILSDRNPRYPSWVKGTCPSWQHKTVKGRRGCIVGGGELKIGGFDPLFSLNHTCAMIRAHVNRLFRRTWNTTKKPERLRDHLWIYMDFHNRRIIEKFT